MDEPLVEGRDYTVDTRGVWTFTRSYLLGRGRCCGSGCWNCPYGKSPNPAAVQIEKPAGPR